MTVQASAQHHDHPRAAVLLRLAGAGAAVAVAGLGVRGWIADGGGDTVRILAWFAGSIVVHDLVFLPLVALADRVLLTGVRRRRAGRVVCLVRNHVRVPAILSGLLLLVFAPSILRANRTDYGAASSLAPDPYLHRWLIATWALFALSAVLLGGRLMIRGRARREPPVSPSGPG